jgi:hypothetical protein
MNPIQVTFQAYQYATRLPRWYIVHLYVNEIPTGIMARVWGLKRARRVMEHMVNNGNDLLNEHGMAERIAAEIYAQRREEAMAKVQVGDSVKLLVDIGPFRKGRVCKVVEVVDSPSFYAARGANAWDDDRFPVKVLPVRVSTDPVSLGPNDHIPLARGEFGPLSDETDDD